MTIGTERAQGAPLAAGSSGPLGDRASRGRRQRRRRAAADRRRRTSERRRPDSSPRAQDIRPGHKIALEPIRAGESDRQVRRSDRRRHANPSPPATGCTRTICAPRSSGVLDYVYEPSLTRSTSPGASCRRSRATGAPTAESGTRNELWVLNTVGCVNHAAERIAQAGGRTIRRARSTAFTRSPIRTAAASSATISRTRSACSRV